MIPLVVAFLLLVLIQWVHTAWWWVLVLPAIAGLFAKRGLTAFFGAGLGAGLAWGLASTLALLGDSHIVAGHVAEMLSVGNPWILVGITAFTAVLCGGCGGLTGYFMKGVAGAKKPPRR